MGFGVKSCLASSPATIPRSISAIGGTYRTEDGDVLHLAQTWFASTFPDSRRPRCQVFYSVSPARRVSASLLQPAFSKIATELPALRRALKMRVVVIRESCRPACVHYLYARQSCSAPCTGGMSMNIVDNPSPTRVISHSSTVQPKTRAYIAFAVTSPVTCRRRLPERRGLTPYLHLIYSQLPALRP